MEVPHLKQDQIEADQEEEVSDAPGGTEVGSKLERVAGLGTACKIAQRKI